MGNQFLVIRTDESGPVVLGRRSAPALWTTAYNGQRQQWLDRKKSTLRLEDGDERASYTVSTPQTVAYAWLRAQGAPPLRWDLILSGKLWKERFADATYAGKVNQGERNLEVVEFPQREIRNPCIWKVFFAPELGYLPTKYIRRLEKTGDVSTTMEVTQFKMFDVEGHRVAVPTEVRYEETGADGASLKQTKMLRMNEGSLKVNEDVDVDESLFTLDTSGVAEIHDVDEFERIVAEIEGTHRRGAIEEKSSGWRFSARAFLLLTSIILFTALMAILIARR